ncbi:MAG TPA: hypothetical protein VEJ39_10855 [Candidatus Acidoferrales bacterium]|nr:hypothetical protein [Candidatus Acidoferrales bacterium]
METAVGVFDSRDHAEKVLRELLTRNVPREAIVFLSRSETVATSAAKEVGVWIGVLLGGTAGMTTGVVAATKFAVLGLGEGLALCVGWTVLLAVAGAMVGSTCAKAECESRDVPRAIPGHQDAAPFHNLLNDGRSVLIVRTPWRDVAGVACQTLDRMGARMHGQPANAETQYFARRIGDVKLVASTK